MRFLKSFLVMLCAISFAHGQSRVERRDSLDMKTQIEGSWYINLIKANRLSTDFYPTFIKSRNGMTTLDFTNYRKGLRKFGFAETFIERKVDGFKACVENLEKLPF